MSIENIMQAMNDARKEHSGNLTIGEALKQLRKLPQDAVIILDKYGFEQIDKESVYYEYVQCDYYLESVFDSYRGYYEDGYIGISEVDNKMTVNGLITLLEDSIKRETMYGYKGGEYTIDEDVILWLSWDGRNAAGIYPTRFLHNKSDNTVLLLTDYQN